jgi:hypothetical protein
MVEIQRLAIDSFVKIHRIKVEVKIAHENSLFFELEKKNKTCLSNLLRPLSSTQTQD